MMDIDNAEAAEKADSHCIGKKGGASSTGLVLTNTI